MKITSLLRMSLVLASATVLPGLARACTYQLSYASTAVAAAGGYSAVQIYTQPGCPWSVSEGFGWLAVTSARLGAGSANVSFYVAPNPNRTARTGWINGFSVQHPSPGTSCLGGRSGCTPPTLPAYRLTLTQYGR